MGPGPVVTEPVWVPAHGEGPMRKGCCSFSFHGTYDLLGEVAAAHPFRVAVKALGDAGGSVEVGRAELPLTELLEDAPVTYRSAVKPKLFRSHGACQRYIDRLGGGGGASVRRPIPIVMRVLDAYVPVALRGEGSSSSGSGAALRAVLVLEDLGPAQDGNSSDAEAAVAAATTGAAAPPAFKGSFMSSAASGAASFLASDSQAAAAPPQQGVGAAAAAAAGGGGGPYPELSVALTLLDVERKKLEFEDWRHKRVGGWVWVDAPIKDGGWRHAYMCLMMHVVRTIPSTPDDDRRWSGRTGCGPRRRSAWCSWSGRTRRGRGSARRASSRCRRSWPGWRRSSGGPWARWVGLPSFCFFLGGEWLVALDLAMCFA